MAKNDSVGTVRLAARAGEPASVGPAAPPTRALPRQRRGPLDVPATRPRWLARLAPLFVAAPATVPPPAWRIAATVGLVILGTATSLFRTPHVFDIIYVEDGTIFLADAAARPFGASLAIPYSGYFQLLPRVLAEFAALAPVSKAAMVLAVEGALANVLLGLFVYLASGGLLRQPLLRLLVSVPIVATPVAHLDLPNSITMLRWPIMYATFWAVLWVPTRRLGAIVGLSVVLLAAFSDNVVPFFLPLALARWALRRDRYALYVSIALAAGTVANAALVISGASRHPGLSPRPNPVWAAAEWLLRPVTQAVAGERWAALPRPHTLAGVAPIAFAWIVVAAVVVVAWRRFTAPNWLLAAVAAGYSLVLYAYVIMLSGFAIERYTLPAVLLLLVSAAALVQPRTAEPRVRIALRALGWRRATPAVALVAVVLSACLANLRVLDYRSTGPLWSTEVARAQLRCAVEGLTTVEVPVSPAHISPVWKAKLPCRYIVS